MTTNTLKIVRAKFGEGGNNYDYFVPAGDEPKVGDLIVTSVSWDGDWQYRGSTMGKLADGCRVARIVEVNVPAGHATKFYLQLISVAGLTAAQASNRELLERAKAREAAKKALDALLEESGRIALYKQLAEINPEAKALLETLTS